MGEGIGSGRGGSDVGRVSEREPREYMEIVGVGGTSRTCQKPGMGRGLRGTKGASLTEVPSSGGYESLSGQFLSQARLPVEG